MNFGKRIANHDHLLYPKSWNFEGGARGIPEKKNKISGDG